VCDKPASLVVVERFRADFGTLGISVDDAVLHRLLSVAQTLQAEASVEAAREPGARQGRAGRDFRSFPTFRDKFKESSS
jgi:hypothetical protein